MTNLRNAFSKFESLIKPVSGVGNAIMYASGRGTINIETKVDGNPHQIVLEDVLYIPSNPHNLLSLGRWDNTGGNYHGGQNILTLYKNGDKIAVGTKIKNHLYKMKNFTVLKCGSTNPKDKIQPHSFNVKELAKSYNTCRAQNNTNKGVISCSALFLCSTIHADHEKTPTSVFSWLASLLRPTTCRARNYTYVGVVSCSVTFLCLTTSRTEAQHQLAAMKRQLCHDMKGTRHNNGQVLDDEDGDGPSL